MAILGKRVNHVVDLGILAAHHHEIRVILVMCVGLTLRIQARVSAYLAAARIKIAAQMARLARVAYSVCQIRLIWLRKLARSAASLERPAVHHREIRAVQVQFAITITNAHHVVARIKNVAQVVRLARVAYSVCQIRPI